MFMWIVCVYVNAPEIFMCMCACTVEFRKLLAMYIANITRRSSVMTGINIAKILEAIKPCFL